MDEIKSETQRIALGLIEQTLPKAEWTHEAHLRAGLWHAFHYDDETALNLMRKRICAYNVATGGVNTETSGYHETITRFYLCMIRACLNNIENENSMDELAQKVILKLGDKELPFRYYTRERLFSTEARLAWVAPDIAALP
ncbi:hypothetical protein [Solimicrobium silvestre]|uniref:Uncharacterized protein n=1 Tax=Solimicrobium silvestre TaxID=2099400 RepID=A0A2S9H4T9_9BURK|nr:hypothetical protein [Solimicrobium silvestre]PRC94978.1 hypothetical protein S2091_0173 [Solimicrobium silvestre]